ncbi:hypothetical protein [Nocardia sp. NPDC019395]|uniref:hypothetical protein n=1 Tax=Nocardia sp. NPDC019395 TaxID=3154686 RepID=UPI0033C6105C
MLKYYARTFLPWIVLALASGIDHRAGALAGLATSAVLLIADRRSGRRFDELILDLSTALFMALFAVFALVRPHSPVLDYGTALAVGWLGVTAWLTLAVGRPFTLGIARRRVDEKIARTTIFQRMNVTITSVWAVCFTLEAVTLVWVQDHGPHNIAALVACKAGFVVVAATFTARYPELVRRRANALAPSPSL